MVHVVRVGGMHCYSQEAVEAVKKGVGGLLMTETGPGKSLL